MNFLIKTCSFLIFFSGISTEEISEHKVLISCQPKFETCGKNNSGYLYQDLEFIPIDDENTAVNGTFKILKTIESPYSVRSLNLLVKIKVFKVKFV